MMVVQRSKRKHFMVLQINISLTKEDIILENEGKNFRLITFKLVGVDNHSDEDLTGRSSKFATVAACLQFKRENGFYVTQVCFFCLLNIC